MHYPKFLAVLLCAASALVSVAGEPEPALFCIVEIYGHSRRVKWTPELSIISAITAGGGMSGSHKHLCRLSRDGRVILDIPLDQIQRGRVKDQPLKPGDSLVFYRFVPPAASPAPSPTPAPRSGQP